MDREGERGVARLLLDSSCNALLELGLLRAPAMLHDGSVRRLACRRCHKYIETSYRHIAVHWCPPEWSLEQLKELGILAERGRSCLACGLKVGPNKLHKCQSIALALVRYDLSALNELHNDDSTGSQQLTQLRRLHGQVIVLLPSAGLVSRPQQTAAQRTYQYFCTWVAPSRIPGAGLGVFCMHSLHDPLPSAQPLVGERVPPSRQLVAPYSGCRVDKVNQPGDQLTTLAVVDGVTVDASKAGGLAVLVNCLHREHANLLCTGVWHDEMSTFVGYLELRGGLPAAGAELGYDYGGWCSTMGEYEDERSNPLCGCGCGGWLLPPTEELAMQLQAVRKARQQAAERAQRAVQRARG